MNLKKNVFNEDPLEVLKEEPILWNNPRNLRRHFFEAWTRLAHLTAAATTTKLVMDAGDLVLAAQRWSVSSASSDVRRKG